MSEPSSVEVGPVGDPPRLPPGWRVSIEPFGSELFYRAELLEHTTFVEETFSEPSELQRIQEYEPWRHASVFHIVSNESQIVGAVRVLIGAFAELPVGHFKTTEVLPPDPVCEYASLAIARGARSSGVAEALYRSVWRYAVAQGTTGLVAIVEEWLLILLRDHYGFGFRQLGSSEWYMGGHCIPIGATHEQITVNLPLTRSLLWKYLTE